MIRLLRHSLGFAAVYVLTLGVSVGAAATVFSVVNGVLLKPLPYPDAEALVSLWNVPRSSGNGAVPLSATQFFTYREESQIFAALGLWSTGTASVTGLAEPEEVRAVRVTHGTLDGLGVAPHLGRWFSLEDDTPRAAETVLLGDGYWRRRFGGDTAIIGRTLVVDARPRIIIGVMPAGFRFLDQPVDLIVPLQLDRANLSLGAFNYFALGRLRPNVTIDAATKDLTRLVPRWLESWPVPRGFDKEAFDRVPVVRSLAQDVVGNAEDVVWLLMGTIALVLLLACANMTNLLLLRAVRRQQEFAVRVALGAGWRRLAREVAAESLLLAVLGAALGAGLSVAMTRALVASAPAGLPRLDDITIDGTVLSFALIVSVGSSLLCGVAPLVRLLRLHVTPSLRAGERTSTGGREQHRTQDALVIVQVAVALVLLVGAGLMVRSFLALRAIEPGFTDSERIQLVRITIPRTLIGDPERVFQVQSAIRDRLAAVPGVEVASFTSAAPLEPFVSANAVFRDDLLAADDGTVRRFKFVSPGYFATMGTAVVAGRDFDWADIHQRRPVAVVSEKMAKEMWGSASRAVGRRLRENPEGPWREIVGVVRDVLDDGLHLPPPAIAYWPVLMENFEGERVRVRRSVTLAMRSGRTGSDAFVREIQQAVWSVSPDLPVARVQTLEALYDRSLARTSFTLLTLAVAAVMALMLGLVGIYGVVSYAVSERRREIAIRVALGAAPGVVRRMFVRRGVVLAGIGVVGGVAAGVVLTRAMSSLLFGISPFDSATYLIASSVLITAAAIASDIPARRASSVDPARALRPS